jgi:hypothetical protein
MRGLDERIALAHARIAAIVAPNSDGADFGVVYYAAYGLGVQDYRAGEFTAPIMFLDEPLLLKAWEDGQDFAAEVEEMAHCEGCKDTSLPMCPYHG